MVSKYGNRKTWLDGILFDSRREAGRWAELTLMQRAGEISELRRQVRFCLIPAILNDNGKTRQRAVFYVADFVYRTRDGALVAEDAKGVRTDVYKIKKKLMLWRHGIEIREV